MFSYGNVWTYESISLKRIGLTPDGRWHTMFAANYVPNVLPIIRNARHALNGIGKRPPYDLDTVERACVHAYQDQRARLVSDTILSKYRLDLANYKREAGNFGPAECARINAEIDKLEVGVQLIVYGYDEWNVAHLFSIDEPGVSICCDQDAFAVAGSGAGSAQSSLLSDDLPIISQAEMICRIAEAKFLAERDIGVGKDSVIGVVNRPLDVLSGTSERFISIGAMDAIRTANSEHYDRPYPRKRLDGIMDELNSVVTSENIGEAVRLAKRILDRRRKSRKKRPN